MCGYYRIERDLIRDSLGKLQFNWLKNEVHKHLRDKSTKVVILHHHLTPLPYAMPIFDLSALEEGANAIDLIGGYGIDLVLHGHRHHPIAHTCTRTNWLKPITFFCAGSFGVSAKERANGRLPNTFHTVKINLNSGDSSFEGEIQTFELNSMAEWVPLIANDYEYPLNPQQWVGVANALQHATNEIQSILTTAIEASEDENYFPLPLYEVLPLNLRCLIHADLNSLLQNEAKIMGLLVTGDYPKHCIASKVAP